MPPLPAKPTRPVETWITHTSVIVSTSVGFADSHG